MQVLHAILKYLREQTFILLAISAGPEEIVSGAMEGMRHLNARIAGLSGLARNQIFRIYLISILGIILKNIIWNMKKKERIISGRDWKR